MFLYRLAADADQNRHLASAMGPLRARRLVPECWKQAQTRHAHHGRLRECVAHAERCSTLAEVPKDMFHRPMSWTVMVAASVTVSLETLTWQHQTALGLPKRVDSGDWNGRACLADPSSRRRLEQCSAPARAVLFVSHQRAKAEAASFMRTTLH